MSRPTPSALSTAANFDLIREAQTRLNQALQEMALAEQCGHDCQQYRQAAQAMGAQLDKWLATYFPSGQRPRQ